VQEKAAMKLEREALHHDVERLRERVEHLESERELSLRQAGGGAPFELAAEEQQLCIALLQRLADVLPTRNGGEA
jgi:hypothetical protein